MKTIVEEIGIFTRDEGEFCPRCRKQSVHLSTTSEYRNWCKSCDIRFTDKGLIYKPSEE
jgi:hypothetical protein